MIKKNGNNYNKILKFFSYFEQLLVARFGPGSVYTVIQGSGSANNKGTDTDPWIIYGRDEDQGEPKI